MSQEIFNTITETGRKIGLNVFSAIKVQCPVWVVHLKMDTRDNDPLFPVDRSILALIQDNPESNGKQISSLIGLEESFVRGRIEALKDIGMLELLENGIWKVTDSAQAVYFNETGERPVVTIYADLVLDGFSLKPLEKDFYEAKATFSKRRSDMIVPRVVMGPTDPALVRAVRSVEKSNGKEKEMLQLDHDSFNYEIVGCELRSIDNVYVVLACNPDTGTGVRKIFFRDRFLSKVDSIEGTLDNYYLYFRGGECHSSEGYMREVGNPLVNMTSSSILEYLSTRYGKGAATKDNYIYRPGLGPGQTFPLVISVDEEMLRRSGEPRKIINDAFHGEIIEYTKEGSWKNRIGGYFRIPVENGIPELVERYGALQKWKKEKGSVDISFIRSVVPAWKRWREDFVQLGLLEELEAIDISQFINENREKEADYE